MMLKKLNLIITMCYSTNIKIMKITFQNITKKIYSIIYLIKSSIKKILNNDYTIFVVLFIYLFLKLTCIIKILYSNYN
jgi:hypothetical protein